ncbi:hypothetical protein H5392_10075 [Tessaracoccus sp. MC1865]|uniref:hypothetical protein n=1 Tax=Tessaracoccus sp. MC1865 TaxID=2760310 RepID=UPI0016042E64|nr:hypothetical protein [Tessaracoccus sp. MC1865]MBB1484203.1 hypothetical protein [Tessaracoccus sp. MC1865]QTO37223.1 hypothetical protein J7D54_12440 [Tessaracoccus sp. MC1865]
MYARKNIPDSLLKQIGEQAQVVSTRQLLEGGLSRRIIARMAQEWTPVAPGLHLLGPPSFAAAAWAGLLRGGSEAVVGGLASGHLHDAVRDAPSKVTVWAPKARADFDLDRWQIRFRRATRHGVLSLRRTTVEVTMLDIADETTENDAVSAVARALAKGLTTPERVLKQLEATPGVRHRAVLRELCGQAGRGIESALEWRFHTEVLLRHGLPIPERQVQRMAGRADAYYREYNLIIELDGMRDHADGSQDMLRDNDNAVHHDGRTLRFGWNGVMYESCRAAGQVASLLWKGGWPDLPSRCARCVPAR